MRTLVSSMKWFFFLLTALFYFRFMLMEAS